MAFKSEEELKEYLENLGTEYRFSCFSEKSAEGCHLLGDYLEALHMDYEAAGKIYKSNCDDNKHPKSCLKYGNYSYLGKGLEAADSLTALNYYKTSCDLGHVDGCLYVGSMLTKKDEYNQDKNFKLDYVTGVKYLEKACDKGNPTACYSASIVYISGAEGVPKDRTKASKLSLAACNGGNVYACMNLSRMYSKGDGVEKSEEKANFFKEKARDIREDYKKKPSIGLQQFT